MRGGPFNKKNVAKYTEYTQRQREERGLRQWPHYGNVSQSLSMCVYASVRERKINKKVDSRDMAMGTGEGIAAMRPPGFDIVGHHTTRPRTSSPHDLPIQFPQCSKSTGGGLAPFSADIYEEPWRIYRDLNRTSEDLRRSTKTDLPRSTKNLCKSTEIDVCEKPSQIS